MTDQLQKAVAHALVYLARRFPDHSLHLVHFLYNSENTGILRRSALHTEGSTLGMLRDITDGAHDTVLVNYIRAFDRNNTLLLLLDSILIESEFDRLILYISLDETSENDFSLSLPLTPTVHKDHIGDYGVLRWQYGRGIPSALLPTPETVLFLRDLYSNPSLDTLESCLSEWLHFFLLARARMFGRQDTVSARKWPGAMEDWRALAALQSALAYIMFGSDPAEAQAFPSATLAMVDLHGPGDTRLPAIPIGALTLAPCREGDYEPSELFDFLRNENNELIGAKNILTQAGLKRPSGGFKISLSPAAETGLEDRIDSIYRSPAHTERAIVLTRWALDIVDSFNGRVHEGRPLSLFLLIGDLSQYKDDPRFIWHDLPSALDEGLFQVPDKDTAHLAERAARVLAHEHFVWFQRGRYALLWDVNAHNRSPTALVGLRSNSWENIAYQRYLPSSEQKIDIPPGVLMFTLGPLKETGGLYSKWADHRLEIRELLQYSDDSWTTTNIEERKSTLLKLIDELSDLDKFQAAIVSQLSILLADNPSLGGTIVLVRAEVSEETASKFIPMGEPWRLPQQRLSLEDRMFLIGHDGASLLLGGHDSTWRHRVLLIPNDTALTRFNNYREVIDSNLQSTGSRRWSAALTSQDKDIDLIIVISQDGDIQIWSSKNDKPYAVRIDVDGTDRTMIEYDD